MRAHRIMIGLIVALAVVASSSACALAADAYYDIPLSDLKITDGQLPKADAVSSSSYRFDQRWIAEIPRIVLEGSGEAYLDAPLFEPFAPFMSTSNNVSLGHVAIRAPQGKDIHGQLFLPKHDIAGIERIKFSVPAAAANDSAKEKFYEAKLKYYERLEDTPTMPGTAWFRHQVEETLDQLNELPEHKGEGSKQGRAQSATQSRLNQTAREDAYDLFSGGRAISESLQLDRQVREGTQNEKPDIEINSLKGITVAAIDWKAVLKNADPKLDPLSRLIPFDQHALFVPSFAAAVALQDEAKGRDTVLLKLAQPQSENLDLMARYQRQLGLTLSDLGRIVGQAAIKSLALTGSDPYFPTGTDVAVLFETDHPDVLAGLLKTQIATATAQQSDAKSDSGEVGGLKFQGIRSPDRQVCSYLAQLNGAVVVTNSLAQLERLANVGHGIDPIASLDEFKFFRTRYPLGDKDETAFLFLSDATIRRWCSPQWRIASARRTFTDAALADLTAENVQSLATGKVKQQRLHTDVPLIDAGELKLTAQGITSSTQGTLAWMTPIIELPINKVTKSEADAYNQWRDNYQRNWRWGFDPIGFRIGVQATKLSGDLTVMPLIIGSEYREFVNISRGAKIAPDAGDRHDALLNTILAININSEPMRQWGNMASMFAPQAHIDPFSWLGSSVSLYVDDDSIWKKLRELPPENRQKEMERLWGRLPIALECEVSSSLKLTAFLTALRAFIDQSAPGMTNWEALTYRDEPYVRVKPTERGRHGLGEDVDVAVYYAPSADGLLVTLNETVLKHAIDRRLGRRAADKKTDQKNSIDATADKNGENTKKTLLPWLGESFCLQVDHRMLEELNGPVLEELAGGAAESGMQVRSWANLPILNEWKQLFPDEDPVKIHQRLWHTILVDPSGGKYVWNDEWKTMESTVYGHPGQPKTGPEGTAAIKQFQNANFGLTFEEQGLRARVELIRDAAK